jgi:hypothetical protein
MMLDKCGNGAAGGEGSAMSKELSGAGMVAYANRVAAVMAGG